MPLPKNALEAEPPMAVAADPVLVRGQLERLLVHPLFANSKRYPALLAYVVEQTLLGHSADLKERSIAVEAFGRDPAYDANSDPVVRITAGEVRKRLSQYYYDPSHAGELIVELPVGSYVPVFRLPELPEQAPASEAETVASDEEVPVLAATRPLMWRLWLVAGAAVLLAGAIGLGLGMHYRTTVPPPPPSAIERFWAPVLASPSMTTFCLGEPAKNIDSASIDDFNAPPPEPAPQKLFVRLQYSGNLALADVITLTRTVAALESHHKPFRVVPASEATFTELREGPIVLIGAFDNIWTLRITRKLRFGFESRGGEALLVDRKNPQKASWATAWDLPYAKLARDYAIVARIFDQTTGQPVIIAAGISEEGTEAAGEILYNPVYLDTLLAHLPAGWEDKNVEAVIATEIIQGHSGPPNILAVETW
jgi:hypothetical protein